MFVNRKAPYGTIYALESLEVVLITATFDQDVSLVFIDDGVYELVKGQQTKGIGIKNFSPTYRALDGYDVEKLYVERESMAERGLTEDDLLVPVEVLSQQRMAALMARTGRGPELLTTRCENTHAAHRQQVPVQTSVAAELPAPGPARQRPAAD
jgi:tRNA 2-thiouridine synthesizing protein C